MNTEELLNWHNYVSHLFTRHEFTARFLERSMRQTEGWIELGIVFALALVALTIATRLERSKHINRIRFRPLRHPIKRVLFPITLLICGIAAQIAWKFFGFSAVWLRLLVLAANWMIMIRLILALLHGALPKTSWSDALERTTAALSWTYFVLWVSGIDDIIITWMKTLEFSAGNGKLNLFTLLTGLLWVGIVMVFMMWLAKWINSKVMASTRLDLNLRIVLSKITKTLLMILSILIALPLVGIDLTVLSVFGGALGVGLGFGLQKIASNYVSGFIILADRSVRPGDRLTVNNFTGYVTEITSRFVVLRSAGGQEALIPNETFVTSTVINESYTEKALYQALDIQVAYKTDLQLALQIMKDAAAAQERVLQEPEPSAILTGFADNGINLRISFWVSDPENGFAGLFSAILLTIWQRFQEEGIEFPYPQREVRILPQSNKE
ncbi:mechanosensitive ion channel [Wielerella bovis]|uniref:mechanosensitive ion channel family protein n=1 Tax=Wielerella bovis TaxID=2917790 RepID=UPI0020184D93|nr:mechanosensitive ion channel domain-containing protein [Wielerella bovis]ULJ61788.1 mechanosensitive ion channel [Wielerella bovis]